MNNRLKRYILSISSGLIMGISWVEITNFFPLIFIALVPLLWIEDEITKKRYRSNKVYFHFFLAFFIFNLVSTWWIYYSSPEGAIIAIVLSGMLIAFPFYFFHLTRKFIGDKEGYIAFVLYILAYEWIDYRWSVSYPWLPFGNIFANVPDAVQWYEYTGIEGGTLWVLLVNLSVFFILKRITENGFNFKTQGKKIIGLITLILVPILISNWIKINIDLGENNEKATIVLSQPNVDPYTKFGGRKKAIAQTKNILEVTKNTMDNTVDLILAPETALPNSIRESNLFYADEMEIVRNFLQEYPNAQLLTGSSTHEFFDKKNSSNSRKMKNGGYWEAYNTALLIDKNLNFETYHKSRLVPGVEKLPLQFITKYMESWFDLGGASGNLATEKEAKIFEIEKIKIAPTICFESIYGEYTSKFSLKGANIIGIITNDAWWHNHEKCKQENFPKNNNGTWHNTPGYRQLLAYAKLRAIENRKWIARSANTGITCFISPTGEIVKKANWGESTSIKMDVPLLEGTTFYAKHGDYISRLALFISSLLLLLTFVKKWKK